MPTDDDPREELKVRILRLIDNTEGISLYQILEELGIHSDGGIRLVRSIVIALVDNDHIEERHFPDGRVDYILDSEGLRFVRKIGRR